MSLHYLKHALQVQHEHCYFHELKQSPNSYNLQNIQLSCKKLRCAINYYLYTSNISIAMSCLQYSDQTFDEGNVFELLQTLYDYIKKTFSNDANGEIDTSDQIALRHFGSS